MADGVGVAVGGATVAGVRDPEHGRVTLCGRDLREYRHVRLGGPSSAGVDEVVELHRCSS